MKNFIFYLTCAISICTSVSYFFSEKEENKRLNTELKQAQSEAVMTQIVDATAKANSYVKAYAEGYLAGAVMAMAQQSSFSQKTENIDDEGGPALPSNGD